MPGQLPTAGIILLPLHQDINPPDVKLRQAAGVVFLMGILGWTCTCFGQEEASDSAREATVDFLKRRSLVVIPVVINDRVRVNLALDPHCQTVVLFGRWYERLLEGKKGRAERNGAERPPLSLFNTISVGPVVEYNVPIVVIPNNNPVNFFTSVNGIIGTRFFNDFDLVMDRRKQTITIRASARK